MIAEDAAAARAIIVRDQRLLGDEQVPLSDAAGRILSQPITAGHDQPPFDAAAMDGWAVAADTRAGDRLAIAGEAMAGSGAAQTLQPGTAVRTATGAPVPAGTTLVVPQEQAREEGGHVVIDRLPNKPHLRMKAGDFATGDTLLPAGTHLDAWHIALAASAGAGDLTVSRRPRLKLIVTGDELVWPGQRLQPGQIYDSLAPSVAVLAASWGAAPVDIAHVRDERHALEHELAASAACDAIILAGGASVGKRDHSRPAAEAAGATILLDGVRMRPGKPCWFARFGDGRALLGLPGNPVAALTCATLFLRPLLLAMQGADPTPRLESAPAASPLAEGTGAETWMRGSRAADGCVSPVADQDTARLTPLVTANLLIHRPAGAKPVAAGEPVTFLRLVRAADL